jgi:hypothetical protein
MEAIFSGSQLSPANFDALLQKWSVDNIAGNLSLYR